jgi:predicted component of type VI protein secretion system
MKLSLEVLTPGKMHGKVLPITAAQFIIGRDPDCQLRPASSLISKRHCAILIRDGKVCIRDFNSTNGTFVNDRQLKGELQLQDGDSLKAGPLAFRVHITAPAAADKPAPPPPTKPAKSPDDTEQEVAALSAGGGTKPAEKPGADDTDADAAALLLSMGDNDPPPGSPGVDSEGIPTGSTVMDMLAPGEGGEAAKGKEGKAAGKADQPAPQKTGDTSAAAKSILDKYWRRPRF